MAGTPYLIDSNILIRWVQPSDPDYADAEAALEILARQAAVLCYTSQNLAEFWNACTRPVNRNGYGLSPQEADRRARLFEEKLRLLPDSPLVHQEWRKLIVAHSVSGVQVYDARLVAAMHVYAIQHILTFNAKDFLRFPDIEAQLPKDTIASR